MIAFYLNQQIIETKAHSGTLLLDYIRHEQRLVGTKEVCREGDCGACTVLVGELVDGQLHYKIAPSCLMPLGNISGKHVVTVEGLNRDALTEIQQNIVEHGATQCGFCTPGLVVALTSFFLNSKSFSDEDVLMAIEGNLCRCTGYSSIIRAAKALAVFARKRINPKHDRLKALIELKILPDYFAHIADQLLQLGKTEISASVHNSIFVAGGTDLCVQRPQALQKAPLLFLTQQADLKQITQDAEQLHIGAAVSTEQLRTSAEFLELMPEAQKNLRNISSLLIREHATLAGNFVNASPIGDLAVIFLALNASLKISSGNNKRELALEQFFLDYKKFDLKQNEVIHSVGLKRDLKNYFFSFEKVSKRKFLDIASVNSALAVKMHGQLIQQARLSAGGVAPIPKFLKNTSNFLAGKTLNTTTINEAIQVAQQEIAPISDVRGSAEYKRLLLGQIIKAHFEKLYA